MPCGSILAEYSDGFRYLIPKRNSHISQSLLRQCKDILMGVLLGWLFDDPSSMTSFSIASNPSQKCDVEAGFSLAADLFRLSSDVALLLFSSEVVLLPPDLFCPCGGKVVSIIMKSGSSKRSLAAPGGSLGVPSRDIGENKYRVL